tara:strand:+ start:137 stop:529 length:393 start_codon:yes stop_codon:yes gene_type:complete
MPGFYIDAMKKHKAEIEDLNAEQLEIGVDSDMNKLADYRNPAYARFKKGMGSISSPVADLKLTGKYHKAIKAKTQGNKIKIINTDSKYEELIKKYPNHLGLTEESREIAADDFLIDEMLIDMRRWLTSRA